MRRLARVRPYLRPLYRSESLLACVALLLAVPLSLVAFAPGFFVAVPQGIPLLVMVSVSIALAMAGPAALVSWILTRFIRVRFLPAFLMLWLAFGLAQGVAVGVQVLWPGAGSPGRIAAMFLGWLLVATVAIKAVEDQRLTQAQRAVSIVVSCALVLGLASLTRANPIDQRIAELQGLRLELDSLGQTAPLAIPPPTRWEDDAWVAETFAPVLLFDDEEPWFPTSVENYLRTAKLVESRGSSRVEHGTARSLANLEQLGAKTGLCPQGLCLELTIGCRFAADRACGDQPDEGRDIAVYWRVVRRDDERGGTPSWLTAEQLAGHPYEDVTMVVQYWLFYYFDHLPTRTGSLGQWHEGDWEMVMVGLEGTRPTFVAFSAHCGGTVVPWGTTRVDAARHSRILVHVAYGSHANYPAGADASVVRDIRTFDCFDLAAADASKFGLAAAAQPVAERIFDLGERYSFGFDFLADRLAPAGLEAQLVPLERVGPDGSRVASLAASFPGRWGSGNFIGGRKIGKGPDSPGCKPLWNNPLREVFCRPRAWIVERFGRCPRGRGGGDPRERACGF